MRFWTRPPTPRADDIPFDMILLEQRYQEGSITPNRVISFDNLQTNNTIGNIDNVIYLIDEYCAFETPTLWYRSQNLHRSGASSATLFWGILVRNKVGADLMARLYTFAIEAITISTLAYLNNTPTPVVTETRKFGSCFITFIAPWRGNFIVFAFSFVNLEWTIKDFNQENVGGAQPTPTGQRVFNFSYADAMGTLV
jgi:hypothetical protein